MLPEKGESGVCEGAALANLLIFFIIIKLLILNISECLCIGSQCIKGLFSNKVEFNLGNCGGFVLRLEWVFSLT